MTILQNLQSFAALPREFLLPNDGEMSQYIKRMGKGEAFLGNTHILEKSTVNTHWRRDAPCWSGR